MRTLILIAGVVALAGCQPWASAHTRASESGERPTSALPEPGVYVLRQAKGVSIPADLKPPGKYSVFDRVLGGRLYLTQQLEYDMIVCSDAVDSAGRVLNPGFGGSGEGKYWAAGGKVYFSDPITDAPPDSTAVQVRADTVEVVGNVFVRDLTGELPPRLPIVRDVCRDVRASQARRTPGQ